MQNLSKRLRIVVIDEPAQYALQKGIYVCTAQSCLLLSDRCVYIKLIFHNVNAGNWKQYLELLVNVLERNLTLAVEFACSRVLGQGSSGVTSITVLPVYWTEEETGDWHSFRKFWFNCYLSRKIP